MLYSTKDESEEKVEEDLDGKTFVLYEKCHLYAYIYSRMIYYPYYG
jgi:hypothetical protein